MDVGFISCEKMKKMSLDEQIDYMTYLKKNKKYTVRKNNK